MPDLFAPFTHLVSAALAAAHAGLEAAGLDPHAGVTWALAIIALVVAVRLAVLPVAVHGVRMAHASASARPALEALRRRYAGRTDLESLQAMRAEQARIQREHSMSALGCLPMLLQLPILFALYRVLSLVAAGQSVGAMDAALVASAGSASIVGVRLAERLGGAASLTEVVVLVAAGLGAAALVYLTQRWFVLPNTVLDGLPEPMAQAQQLLPALSAVGVLVAAATVPAGLLLYWLVSNLWTLGQQAVVTRWFPTPGSPAHAALLARRAAPGTE